MQPTPLTGTATSSDRAFISSTKHPDAAHTPHGDGNFAQFHLGHESEQSDAAHTPHGDGNTSASKSFIIVTSQDAAHTPHGDGNT